MSDTATPAIGRYDELIFSQKRSYSLTENQVFIELIDRSSGLQATQPIPLDNLRPEFGTVRYRHPSYNKALVLLVFGFLCTTVGCIGTMINQDAGFVTALVAGILILGWCIIRLIKTWKLFEAVQFFSTAGILAFHITKNRPDNGEFEAFVKVLVERIIATKEAKPANSAATRK